MAAWIADDDMVNQYLGVCQLKWTTNIFPLVMFFMLTFFLLAVLQISEINSFTINERSQVEEFFYEGNENTFYPEDEERRKSQSSSSYTSSTFENIETSSNLKFNVFDKMLSDEMLSIQQHLYEKDITFPPPLQTTSKNNIRTPTLEVKQKWSFQQFVPKSTIIDNDRNLEFVAINTNKTTKVVETESLSTNYSTISADDFLENESLSENDKIKEEAVEETKPHNKKKAIGLRSLYKDQPHNHNMFTTKICTCMKTNPSSTCSHPCTGLHRSPHKNHPLRSGETTKEHKKRCTRHPDECTHAAAGAGAAGAPQSYPRPTPPPPSVRLTPAPYGMPPYPPPYYPPFPSYFLEMTTVIPLINAYYYTKDKSSIKTSRGKQHNRKKIKLPNDDNKKPTDYEEYSYYKNEKDDHEVINIELGSGEVVTEKVKDRMKTKKVELNKGIYDEEHDNFVNSIVEDLKTHYSEVVIRECFCSSSCNNLCSLIICFCALLALIA